MSRLVSVLIPTYNRSHLLRKAVLSALSQTYAELEVVVTDNSVDDKSRKVIESIGSERVRYLKNETNIGPIRNWRKALDHAKGEFAILLPDDDYLLNPFYIEEAIAIADKNKCGLVITNCLYGRNNGISCSYLELPEIINGRHFLHNFWQGPYTIPTIANLFNVELVNKLDVFSDNDILYSDIECWLKLMVITDVAYYKTPSVYYSFHEQNNIVTTMNVDQLIKNSIFINNVCEYYVNFNNEVNVQKLKTTLLSGYVKLLSSIYGFEAWRIGFIKNISAQNCLNWPNLYRAIYLGSIVRFFKKRAAKLKNFFSA